jgi:hypothetical protein
MIDLTLDNDNTIEVTPLIVGELLSSTRTADFSENEEALDSNDDDDDNLYSIKQILASLKRAKRVINLTGDDNDDREGGNDNFIEIN